MAVPLKHFTYGFYSIHQVVELPERNSESKGTEAQPQHTFSNTSHSLSFNRALYRRNIFTFPKKKKEYQKQSSLQSVLVLFWAGMLCMLGSDGRRARQSENGKRARQRERKKSERERARKEWERERERERETEPTSRIQESQD